MNKKTLFLSTFAVFGMILSLGSAILSGNVSYSKSDASVGSYSTNASTYYSGITATSGANLLGQLHDLLATTHKTYTTYDDCKSPTYVYATDAGTSSSYIRDFYTQNNIASSWGSGATGTWNREHVWCQSLSNNLWGTSGGGSDLQHLRPTECTLNSTRNNNPYGVVASHTSSTAKYSKNTSSSQLYLGDYLSDGVFEPLDGVKGDVARILMYVYTHYTSYTNLTGANTNGSGSSSYFGSLDITQVVYTSSGTASAAWALLLTWNSADPIDSVETARNNAAAKYQGNRNPFIDNSSYANAIWGNGTANSGSSGSSDDSGSSTDTNSATITMKYSDTFSPVLPTSSTAANTSATSHTDSTAGLTFKEKGIYKASSSTYIMFKSGSGYIYNTSSLGTISSIAVTYSSGTSTSGKIGVYFASSAKSTYTTTSNATIGGKSATDTFTNSTSGYGYFQISTSTANVQIVSVVITYGSSSSSSGDSGSSSGDTGSGTTVTAYTKTVKYSDTFSPALPSSSTAVNTSVTSHTDSTANLAFKEKGIYKYSSSSYIMFKSNAGYIYNSSTLGTISSIAVTYSSGTSTSGKIGVYFASSAKSSYTTSSNVTIGGKSATDTFTNSTSGYGYFQISTSTANVQIVSIVINYAV